MSSNLWIWLYYKLDFQITLFLSDIIDTDENILFKHLKFKYYYKYSYLFMQLLKKKKKVP